MPARTRTARRRLTAVAVAASLISGTLAVVTAQAEPRPSIEEVQAQVEELQHVAEAATEDFNAANADLAAVNADLAGLEDRLARQKEQSASVTRAIEDLARSVYMSGSFDPALQVLLAEDPERFLAQAAATSRVAASQQRTLRNFQTARLRVAQTEAALLDRRDRARRLKVGMADAKARADAELSRASQLLERLTAEQRRQLQAIRDQKRAQAVAEARRASEEIAAQSRPSRPSSRPGKPARPSRPTSIPAVSGRAATAVRYALAQVGKRYVRAAAGPSAFDCSGLTLRAWAQAGVSLTHYSVAQWNQTRRVPVSQIKPGDLVFYFERGVKHVSIYVGNGKMVSASNPDDGVELIDFLGPWYGERFSGVGRVLS